MTRPTKKTIETVLNHLQSLDLNVYGPNFVDNVDYPSYMDYTLDDILARRKAIEKGLLEEADNNG